MIGYWPTLLPYALGIFGGLALIQLAMPAIEAVASGDMAALFSKIAATVLRLGITEVFLWKGVTWAEDVLAGFQQIAGNITGLSPATLTPSGVFDAGLAIVDTLESAYAYGDWLHPIHAIETAILIPIIFLAFLGAALIYMWELILATWTIFTGPIWIALSALDYTFDTIIEWAIKVLAASAKVLILILVLAVGMVLVNGWSAQLVANTGSITTNLYWLFVSVAQAVLFCLMVKIVPGYVVSIVGRAITVFNFGEQFAGSAPGKVASGAQAAVTGGASVAKAAASSFAENSHHKMIFKL